MPSALGTLGFQIKATTLLQRGDQFAKKTERGIPAKKKAHRTFATCIRSITFHSGSPHRPACLGRQLLSRSFWCRCHWCSSSMALRRGGHPPALEKSQLLIPMKLSCRTTEISAEHFVWLWFIITTAETNCGWWSLQLRQEWDATELRLLAWRSQNRKCVACFY